MKTIELLSVLNQLRIYSQRIENIVGTINSQMDLPSQAVSEIRNELLSLLHDLERDTETHASVRWREGATSAERELLAPALVRALQSIKVNADDHPKTDDWAGKLALAGLELAITMDTVSRAIKSGR